MDEPTAQGLASAVGRAVSDGVIAAGDRLPPIRTVATQLGLSPTTISSSWALLRRAGTLRTEGRRGSFITTRRGEPVRYRSVLGSREPYRLDLSTGTPDPALLPDLTAALRRVRPPAEPTTYLDDPVLPELDELLRADWPFPAQQLSVVDGAMDAMELIVATHLRYGDRVAVEQPCFPPLLDLLDTAGATAIPVDLDEEGPRPEALKVAIATGVRALFIQPRAQNPSGATLTPARLDALARILRDTDLLVVEDDSAGAIATTPVCSLGRAVPKLTVHVRSYSKSHGPDLRLAALGGPTELVGPVVDRRFLGQGWTSRLLQQVLVDLLTHPASGRTVRSARESYAQRRSRIIGALSAAGIEVSGRDGLNIWLPVRHEAAALLRLATDGIGAAAGGPFWVASDYRPHLRVTTGLIRTGHTEIAAALADAATAPGQPVRR